jgi:hypothetical protein
MTSKVKETTVNKIKHVQYFGVLVDCTGDAGLVEHMSIILRYVDTETGFIEEHFVGFVAVQEKTAAT